MNILILIDKDKSAIGVLARAVEKHLPHFNIKVWAVHPKRPNVKQLSKTPELLEWADLISCEYWKTGKKVAELWPDRWAAKKKILVHHNPYDTTKETWDEYDAVVVKNKTQQADLPKAHHIPHGIDLDFYKYMPQTENKTVNALVCANL